MVLARVLCGVLAIGVVIAGFVLWRATATASARWARYARWIVAALAAYGAVSFVYAAVTGITAPEALRGHGLFQALPYVLQGAFIGGFVVLPLGWIVSIIRAGMPRFREGSPIPFWYQAVVLTVCVALVIAPLEVQGPRAKALDPQARIALLDRSLRALEDGDREMPRDTWDPDYVVAMVGRDPQRLFRWVRDNTYWIPYRGVLRGPVGVLMDRQGNSLDRAILLATLLERAGLTVRLAHGELTRAQATEILPQLVANRELAFAKHEGKVAALGPDLRTVTASYQLDEDSIGRALKVETAAFDRAQSELDARVANQTERLLSAIEKPDVGGDWARRFGDAVSALSDHWWVQQQRRDQWVDFDLLHVAGTNSAPLTAAKDTTPINALADSLHHAITIRVISEQWASGKLTERKSLEQMLRPAELIGQPIVLQFWPAGWISDSGENQVPSGDFRRAVREERVWFAGLVVGRNVVAHGILLDAGDDSDAAVKGGPMAGLATAFADSMPNRGQDAGQDKQLSAVWIEYEIRVPGDRPRIIRRNVFDLIGPEARAAGAPKLAMSDTERLIRGLALTMRTEFLPLPCNFAPVYLLHLAAQSLIGNNELIHAAVLGHFAPGTLAGDALLERSTPVVSSLYSLAAARMEWSRQGSSIFINEPGLLTKHTYPAVSGNDLVYSRAFDVVANNVGVSLAVPDGFRIRLAQGVLDTNAESLLEIVADSFGNAGDAFAKSRAWVRVAEASQAGRLKLPGDVRRRIADDVSSGYEVIAPESAVPMPHEAFAGWWRVDRATGNALGMGANGWGAEAEYTPPVNAATIWSTRVNQLYATAAAGFVAGFGFCLAKELLVVRKKEGIWMGEALDIQLQQIGEDCGPEGIGTAIVSAVLPLFVLTFKGAFMQLTGRFARWARPAEGLAEKGFKGTPYGEPGAPPNGVGNAPKGGPGGRPRPGGGPTEPGAPNSEPNAEGPKPPSDDPCDGSPQAQSVSPQPAASSQDKTQDVFQSVLGDPQTSPKAGSVRMPGAPPTAQTVQDALDTYTEASRAYGDTGATYVRYQARQWNVKTAVGYDPSLPGPQDYNQAVADQLWNESRTLEQSAIRALHRFDELYDAFKAANPDVNPFKQVGAACGPAKSIGPDTLGLGPGNTRPLGPGGPPSPIGPPIGPPPGTAPPEPMPAAGPATTQPMLGAPDPGAWPPPGAPSPPPGTSPPGPGSTQPLTPQVSSAGQPIGPPPVPAPGPGITQPLGASPGAAPPGISPFAKTMGGMSSALNALGQR